MAINARYGKPYCKEGSARLLQTKKERGEDTVGRVDDRGSDDSDGCLD